MDVHNDTIATASVAQKCREETVKRSELGHASHCFELFRRAIIHNDEDAWLFIDRQYRSMVCRWVQQMTNAQVTFQLANELAGDALLQLWRTLKKRLTNLDEHFSGIGPLLAYLKRCTLSTIQAYRRKQAQEARLQKKLEENAAEEQSDSNLADRLTARQEAQRLLAWIEQNVTDPREQLILEATFIGDLSPTKICRTYAEQFETPLEVRRIKDRLYKRIRRSFNRGHDE